MFDGHRDDASYWTNFVPSPHPAETARLGEFLTDEGRAQELLDFGFRPLGEMDVAPYNQPQELYKPWEPKISDLSSEPILVDIETGWRFRYDAQHDLLKLDLELSDNFLDAQFLMARAVEADSPFIFKPHVMPAYDSRHPIDSFPLVEPVDIHAESQTELEEGIAHLRRLFCDRLGATRLWYRGQRQEHFIARSADISQQLYGQSSQHSLHPSLGRFAAKNPEKLGFGFAFAGPNHLWKKPFMVWLMRQNENWFRHDARFLSVLNSALRDSDDQRFVRLLLQIEMSPIEMGDPPFLEWPDEADDLRQWFFASMKRFEFGVTLQQYGYYTSLLDLTECLDVAVYFTQARMVDGSMRKQPPQGGRLIYVFAERRNTSFFKHGEELFWGDEGWVRDLPPRLARQKAGFISGSTNRTQNFYGNMVIAKIRLGDDSPQTTLEDEDLFPKVEDDLLFQTLRESRPVLEELY